MKTANRNQMYRVYGNLHEQEWIEMKTAERNQMYRVYGNLHEQEFHDDYLMAFTAQDAANQARDIYGEDYTIVEIAKVVRNWK